MSKIRKRQTTRVLVRNILAHKARTGSDLFTPDDVRPGDGQSDGAVRAALNRLVALGIIERVSVGTCGRGKS